MRHHPSIINAVFVVDQHRNKAVKSKTQRNPCWQPPTITTMARTGRQSAAAEFYQAWVLWSQAGQGRWLEKTWSSAAAGSRLRPHEAALSWSVPLSATCQSTSSSSQCRSLVDMATPLHDVTINQLLYHDVPSGPPWRRLPQKTLRPVQC